MSGPEARCQEERHFEPKTMPCAGTAIMAPHFPPIAILASCFPSTTASLKILMKPFWGKMSEPEAQYREARQFGPKRMPCIGTAIALAPRFHTIASPHCI